MTEWRKTGGRRQLAAGSAATFRQTRGKLTRDRLEGGNKERFNRRRTQTTADLNTSCGESVLIA
ncbi:MAG: hypothetical protein P8075_04380 [Deltaproteobacteria bacterium]